MMAASVGAVVATWTAGAPPDKGASEIDNAVLVDLPPIEAAAHPASDAAEGPEQAAAPATPAQATPVEPPKDQPSKDDPEPADQPNPAALAMPPLPTVPDPPAVLERKQQEAKPIPPVAASATQARDRQAPAGAALPTATDTMSGDDGPPRASAQAITFWQKSMLHRLEAAKRTLGSSPGAGSVRIAFEIDSAGALVAERIAASSGSPALDALASQLVRRAAPFPPPPPGMTRRDLTFVAPIRFR